MTQKTLKEMSHTHPATGESFGRMVVYCRGPVVAADGGTATSEEQRSKAVTLGDIDHTPPYDEQTDLNRVYERGVGGV